MQFVENGVLFAGNFLDPLALFLQLSEDRILSTRYPMHPPEADTPATKTDHVSSIEQLNRVIELRISTQASKAIGALFLIRVDLAGWR